MADFNISIMRKQGGFHSKTIMIISTFIIFSLNIRAQNQIPEQAKEYLRLAVEHYNSKDSRASYDYCLKAIDIYPDYGDAYLLIGSTFIQTANSCFDTDFEKDMVFCLAVDMFEKAKSVDSTVVERANQMIEIYSRYFPSKECVFIPQVDGDKYIVGCWINKETTLRFSDY